MYGIYANIWGIFMVNVTIYIYIAYMDLWVLFPKSQRVPHNFTSNASVHGWSWLSWRPSVRHGQCISLSTDSLVHLQRCELLAGPEMVPGDHMEHSQNFHGIYGGCQCDIVGYWEIMTYNETNNNIFIVGYWVR